MLKLKHKKAQAGLNIVVVFVIGVLTLAVLAMATLITLNSLSNSYTSSDVGGSGTSVWQSSTTAANIYSVCGLGGYLSNCGATAVNGSSNSAIPASNYTVAVSGSERNCTIVATSTGDIDYGKNWNVTSSYTCRYGGLKFAERNISNGISEFFENAPTFFTLLAVVVIILIISLVILAVRRFSGSSEGMGGSAGMGSGGAVEL